MRALVDLNRWCYFKFSLWFLTSLKCSVVFPAVFRVAFIRVLYFNSNSPWTHVCRCMWGVVVLFYLHEMLLTKRDNHVFGKAIFYCFKQKQKVNFSDLVTFWGSRIYIKLFNLLICEKIILAAWINFMISVHCKFSKWTKLDGGVINLFESNMLGNTKWKQITVDLHVEIG